MLLERRKREFKMRKIPDIITEEEFITLIRKVRQKHHRIAFLLGFYACMRVSEVINLKKENIDRGQRIIRIKQAKGSKDRNIPIPPQTVKGLSHIPIKCGARALQIAFRKYGKDILNKEIRFHTLRHSGATHYLNKKKWSTRKVQQLLGHSKIQTTDIYTHVTPQDLIDEMYEED